ncbi:MAG: hypothetical protein N4A71_21225 [Carboxylicivirga sp.]|jgi:hypothetical protein|nr:hypothetical protein [Carboxylicivirga sp.]
MKKKSGLNLAAFLTVIILTQNVFGQNNQNSENSVFNPKGMDKEFFISTNSGILKTPYGIKIGYICNPGIYLGFRYGTGEEWEYDEETKSTNLYSIVAGLTKPLIIKNDFSLVAQLGLGYGQWWDSRRVSWTKSGIELEGGLMMKKKHFLANLTGNWLNGSKTYSTGDLCLGVGYVF